MSNARRLADAVDHFVGTTQDPHVDPDDEVWKVAADAAHVDGYQLAPVAQVAAEPDIGPPGEAERWHATAAVHIAHIARAAGAGRTAGPCRCHPGPVTPAVLEHTRVFLTPWVDVAEGEAALFYCARPGCDGRPHDDELDGWGHHHARADQRPPEGDWRTWLSLSGRGAGKTRSGSEWVHALARRPVRLAVVGPTADSVRAVQVEGESGLLATAHPLWPVVYEPSRRRLVWPRTGAIGYLYSAEEPDRLRGPQHDAAWCDEMCHYPGPGYLWDVLLLGLRSGHRPRVYVTTTPKPSPWLTTMLADERVTVVHASTYDNLPNLAPEFADHVLARYRGTRLERQEILGEVLDDIEGALWTRAMIDGHRVDVLDDRTGVTFVVGVDPSGSQFGDECGIVVVGFRAATREVFVVEDASGRHTPAVWSERAVAAARRWGAVILAETNYGGSMVAQTLRTAPAGADVTIETVTASRSKADRAEAVVALYEKGQVHHVGHPAQLAILEAQLLSWVPGDASPDRMDALVHAVTHLALRFAPATVSSPVGLRRIDRSRNYGFGAGPRYSYGVGPRPRYSYGSGLRTIR